MAFFIGGSIEVLSISEGNAKTAAEVVLTEEGASEDIITVTAVFDEDVKLSLQAGMNAHLCKPVEAETLIRVLGEMVYESEESITV